MRYKGKKGKCWELIKQICRKRSKDCFTCTAKDLESYNAQAGHFLPVGYVGSNNRLSWDTRQIRLQCGHCNGVGQGMQVEFRKGLVKELGEDLVSDFERRQHKTDPVRNWDILYEELRKELFHIQSSTLEENMQR